MHVPFRRIPTEKLIPKNSDDYVDTGLLANLECLSWGNPLILKGPKGTGKTLSIEEYCAKHSIPLIRLNCNSETDSSHLIGRYLMAGEEVFFSLGAITTAIDVANEEGGAVLCLEEINTLRPEMQSAVFSVSDYRQSVEDPASGKVFKTLAACRLWVVGTMNPGYGGTYTLNEALRSRFDYFQVPYMDTESEKRVLEDALSTPPGVSERRMINGIINIAKETRGGKWEYALSTRDLVHFINTYEKFGREETGLQKSLKMLEWKLDAEYTDDFRARVESAFRVNLAEVNPLGG